jgi:hypothetical protein
MFACTKSEFDIFARKPLQSAILGNFTTLYKSIAPVDQSVLEFAIPGDNEHYIDLNVHLMVRGKFTKLDGTTVPVDDRNTGVNNLLHSLFSQLNVTLNGVSVTPSEDLYHYRSYLETLLTYGQDASKSHLTNCFWYIDVALTGDDDTNGGTLKAGDSNSGWKKRFEKSKNSKEIVMYGKLHGDIFNISTLMMPGVSIQIKLTKSKEAFYLLGESPDPKVKFQFLDASLYVRKIKPSPNILLAHSKALTKTNARYDVTRVDVRSFTFGPGQRTLSIDNAVLGPLPKRLLFAMTGNTNFSGTPDTNPFDFKHYDIEQFAIYMNGQQIPSEGLSIDTSHEKGSTIAYQSLFSGSGIHHTNSGIQITHEMYISGHFLLLFDLTPDGAASEGHISLPSSGNVRIELRFKNKLSHAITCILYCEYENSVSLDKDKRIHTDF